MSQIVINILKDRCDENDDDNAVAGDIIEGGDLEPVSSSERLAPL